MIWESHTEESCSNSCFNSAFISYHYVRKKTLSGLFQVLVNKVLATQK